MNNTDNKETTSDNRREFIKKSALLGFATVFNPLSDVIASNTISDETDLMDDKAAAKKETITFLITTDIHSQMRNLCFRIFIVFS